MRLPFNVHAGSHYAPSQDVIRLRVFGKLVSDLIKKQAEKENASPVLVYAGYSGAALATAVQLAYYEATEERIAMFYVRREDEKSHHGARPESNFDVTPSAKLMPVFVDDIISSGVTFRRVMREYNKAYPDHAVKKAWTALNYHEDLVNKAL